MPALIRNELFAVTAPGLESIALGELKRLGLKGKEEIGGVAFRGEAEAGFTSNLWLRSASRIVKRIARFHASTFHELERRAKQVAWAELGNASSAARVRVARSKFRPHHSAAGAAR